MATVVVAPRSHKSKELRRHTLIYLGLTPFLVLAVFPILWMAITAIKQDADLYLVDAVPFWFRQAPTWKNFDFLFHNTSYGDWIVNTMLISFWVSAITLLTAVPAGYALARLRLPFAENLGIGIFMTYLVPAIILFIPLARVVSTLDLQDSWWSLVVVYPTFTIPFCTWLLMGFFKTVPFEIEEAAMVDGCGQLGALLRVVLPVSWPGVITATIFSFTLSMQDFLYSLAFVSISDQKPVPLGVATELIRGDIYFWGSLMAGALLVGVPVAIVYNLFLDKFITGITGAAIK
ncbi:MAG TPA: carbohydrate ABC transporter permease [Streptosporangiaceae bacterium]|nr:carbohydrate ABC transporter permease [Streptosporangiaceae bacterium]